MTANARKQRSARSAAAVSSSAGALPAQRRSLRASRGSPGGGGRQPVHPAAGAVRVVDTREPGKYVFTRHWDNHISVPISGSYGVPAEAAAIVATVTAVNLSMVTG